MKQYIIKKDDSKVYLVTSISEEGYIFSPKKFNQIKKITIQDKDLLQNILVNKVDKEYSRLLQIVYYIIEDDDTEEGDVIIGLSEIDRIESMILDKYRKYISDKTIKKYIELINRLKSQLYEFKIYHFIDNETYLKH